MTRPTPPMTDTLRDLPSQVKQRAASRDADWTIAIRLITPLFGGGHAAGKTDPDTPISAKAIRGHLRFWWRATLGGRLENPTGLTSVELMALRETEIFGSTILPSAFDLEVCDVCLAGERKLNEERLYGFTDGFGPEAYALFAAKQNNIPSLLREGATFTVAVRWLDAARFERRCKVERRRRKDVNRVRRRQGDNSALIPEDPWTDLTAVKEQLRAAMWAWLNFGGLGSHTRRGLGAVTSSEPKWSLLDAEDRLRCTIPNTTIHCGKVASGADAEMKAWRTAVGVYRDFRQAQRATHRGRRKQILKSRPSRGPNKKEAYVDVRPVESGRSDWPEPDAIRDATGSHLVGQTISLPNGQSYTQNDHSTPTNSDFQGRAFPRALLGLPIIFQFADGPGLASRLASIANNERDPEQVQLVPRVKDAKGKLVKGERMASPVITRPLLVGGAWRPALIVMRRPELSGLTCQLVGPTVNPRHAVVANAEICGAGLQQLAVMHGESDALSALQHYAERHGFEVFAAGEVK